MAAARHSATNRNDRINPEVASFSCVYSSFFFFTNVKLQKKQVFSFHHFFFQDYAFNGVGGCGADISFIDQLVAVYLKFELLHPFYFQSSRSRRRGKERRMVRCW